MTATSDPLTEIFGEMGLLDFLRDARAEMINTTFTDFVELLKSPSDDTKRTVATDLRLIGRELKIYYPPSLPKNRATIDFLLKTGASFNLVSAQHVEEYDGDNPYERAYNCSEDFPSFLRDTTSQAYDAWLDWGMSPQDCLESLINKFEQFLVAEGTAQVQRAMEFQAALEALQGYIGGWDGSAARLIDNVKGVIDDFDGTLVDSSALHEEAWKHVATRFGRGSTDVSRYRGTTTEETVRLILPHHHDHDLEDAVRMKHAYVRARLDRMQLFPGVAEVLHDIEGSKRRIGICSSGTRERVELVYETTQLSRHIRREHLVAKGDYARPKLS